MAQTAVDLKTDRIRAALRNRGAAVVVAQPDPWTSSIRGTRGRWTGRPPQRPPG
ncbi:MAG: hypothetical protein R3F43_24880 [bacterium]